MPERFYQASNFFKYCGPRLKDCRGDGRGVIGPFRSERQGAIEPFRGDNLPPPSCLSAFIRHLPPPAVIPEIFYRESTLLKPWTPARKSPGWRTGDDRTVQEWRTRRITLCGRAREEYVVSCQSSLSPS